MLEVLTCLCDDGTALYVDWVGFSLIWNLSFKDLLCHMYGESDVVSTSDAVAS